MHRLIYTSKAAAEMSSDELGQILRAARKGNAKGDVTGFLTYHDGCFLQVLEGDEASVHAYYRRIRRDARHYDCVTLADNAVIARMFSESWMTYRLYGDLTSGQQKQLASLTSLADERSAPSLVDDLKVNALLLAFLAGFRRLEMAG